MATYRIIYRISGIRKEAIWQCDFADPDMSALGRWLMSQEFPHRLYRVDWGMQVVLLKHGITDVYSPTRISW